MGGKGVLVTGAVGVEGFVEVAGGTGVGVALTVGDDEAGVAGGELMICAVSVTLSTIDGEDTDVGEPLVCEAISDVLVASNSLQTRNPPVTTTASPRIINETNSAGLCNPRASRDSPQEGQKRAPNRTSRPHLGQVCVAGANDLPVIGQKRAWSGCS